MAAVKVFFLAVVFVVCCGGTQAFGWSCYSNRDCGSQYYCCNNRCRMSCAGYSCTRDRNCGDSGNCCDKTCRRDPCGLPDWLVALIVVGVLFFAGIFFWAVVRAYCLYKRSRSPGLIFTGTPVAAMPITTMVAGSNAEGQGPPPLY